MADDTKQGSRIMFDVGLLERAQAAASERGLSIHKLVNLSVEDFLDRLLPAEQIQWTRSLDIAPGQPPSDGGGEFVGEYTGPS